MTTPTAEIIEPANRVAVDALRLRLAAQAAPHRWKPVLRRLAEDVQSKGQTLEQSVASLPNQAPAELRYLLREACRTNDPGRLVLDALRTRVDNRRRWATFLGLCLYPLLLVLFALAIGIGFALCMQTIINVEWIDDFGLAGAEQIRSNLSDQYHAIMGISLVVAWSLLLLVTVYLVGPPWAWMSVVGGMVAIGKPMRWLSLHELLSRIRLFIDQQPSITAAAQAAARSLAASPQSIVAHNVARQLELGVPLGRALGDSMLSDGLCRPGLYLLDQRGADLPSALEETADLLSRLTDQRLRTLNAIMPLFALAFVGSVVWASVNSYVMVLQPIITLINALA